MEKLEKEDLQSSGPIHLVAGDQLMDLVAPQLQLFLDRHARLSIWEIQERFKCPVIGWCFDIAEQKEVLKKEGISTKDKSNFEIHEIVVESLAEENHLSRRIDSWLNRKYQKEIKELSSLKQEEFIRRWNASLKKGEVEGILWVAVTKTDLSTEVEKSIFGDMHMEMHVRAKQLGKERQRLDQEAKRNEILSESVREVSRTNRILKRENEDLKYQLAIVSRLSDTLRSQNQELENELSKVNENDFIAGLQKENAELRAGRDEVLKQISVYERELRKLQNQNKKLLFKLKKQWQTRIHGSSELGSPINQNADSSLHDRVSSLDLSQMCVLLVGGLPQMESLYRRMIEGNKGVFEYHDGRMNAGAKELGGQVRRADLVLCCIDHSSHTAASVVKKLCKKYKKPLQMLFNSSLNNIFLTLLAVRDNLASIQNGQDDFHNDLFGNRSRELILQ
jgi:hypothetical protein